MEAQGDCRTLEVKTSRDGTKLYRVSVCGGEPRWVSVPEKEQSTMKELLVPGGTPEVGTRLDAIYQLVNALKRMGGTGVRFDQRGAVLDDTPGNREVLQGQRFLFETLEE